MIVVCRGEPGGRLGRVRGGRVTAAEIAAARIVALTRAIGAKYPNVGLGASVGFAVSPGGTHASADDFIRAADAAMYEAKERRRGSYVVRTINAEPALASGDSTAPP